MVQIDLDPQQIGANYPVEIGIVADARAALAALNQELSGLPRASSWGPILDLARAARQAKPEWLIETLREELPDETPVFTDACEMGYRMQADWPSYGPRRFFYPSNYITLGWAFPAALGAAVALDGQTVVSVSGDGGFLMTAQELATATRYRLPVIAVVHNDSAYGAIKNIQDRVHGGRFLDTDLNNPDFLALAAAFGVPGHRASSPDQLRTAVRESLARGGPSLIEVPDQWRFLRDLAVPAAEDRASEQSRVNRRSGCLQGSADDEEFPNLRGLLLMDRTRMDVCFAGPCLIFGWAIVFPKAGGAECQEQANDPPEPD